VIGGPVSGLLLYLQGGLGFTGWQWLFIMGRTRDPSLRSGLLLFTDRPLTHLARADERAWLAERLTAEERQRQAVHNYSVVQSLFKSACAGTELVYSAWWR